MLTVVALIIHMADVREALGHTHTPPARSRLCESCHFIVDGHSDVHSACVQTGAICHVVAPRNNI